MHQKHPNKKVRKFRILLDAAFAKPEQFPKLNKKAKLIHVVYDLGLSREADDKDIYQKATQEECIILTVNFDDFKKLVKIGGAGVIGIPSQLFNEQVDKRVVEFIFSKDPDEYLGKAIKI